MPKRQKSSPDQRDDIVQVTVMLESRTMRNATVVEAFETISIKVDLRANEAARYVEAVRRAVRQMTLTAAGDGSWFESSIKAVPPEAGDLSDEL